MANQSSSEIIKTIDTQVNMILRGINQLKLEEKASKAVTTLRQSLADARIYAADYELSEMREEQLEKAKSANKYLEQSRQALLRASEYNVFGPVDVAHLSAKIDQLKAELR